MSESEIECGNRGCVCCGALATDYVLALVTYNTMVANGKVLLATNTDQTQVAALIAGYIEVLDVVMARYRCIGEILAENLCSPLCCVQTSSALLSLTQMLLQDVYNAYDSTKTTTGSDVVFNPSAAKMLICTELAAFNLHYEYILFVASGKNIRLTKNMPTLSECPTICAPLPASCVRCAACRNFTCRCR